MVVVVVSTRLGGACLLSVVVCGVVVAVMVVGLIEVGCKWA